MANNNTGKNKDPFIAELDLAINKLKELDNKVKSSNDNLSSLKNKSKDASAGIGELSKSIGELDSNKSKKLVTITKHIKKAIEILQAFKAGEIKVTKEFMSDFSKSLNKIGNITIDTSSLDKLSKSIDNLNVGLEKFIKLSSAIDAINFDKLMKNGINITDASGKSIVKPKRERTPKQIVNDSLKGNKFKDLSKDQLSLTISMLETSLKDKPDKAVASALGRAKFARGDWSAGGVLNPGNINDTIAAINSMHEFVTQKKKEIDDYRDSQKLDRGKTKAEEQLRELNTKIAKYEERLKNEQTNLAVINALIDAKFKRGDYLEPADAKNITDADYVNAAKRAEAERKRLTDDAKNKREAEKKKVESTDDKISRMQRQKEEAAKLREASRNLINQRTEDRLQSKLNLATSEEQYLRNNAKSAALFKLINTSIGGNSPILTDLMDTVTAFKGDSKTVNVLKKQREVINAESKLAEKRIDNEEITGRNRIKAEGLSAEQRALLADPNLTDEQRTNILNSSLSNEEVVKKLNEFGGVISNKRKKLSEDTNNKLLENSKQIEEASIKAAKSMGYTVIAINVLKKTLVELYRVTEKAAKANRNIAASLKSMGAASNEASTDSIKYFTNELDLMATNLNQISKNIGDTFGASFAGWMSVGNDLLELVDAFTERVKDAFHMVDSFNFSGDKGQNINYSTAILEGIANKLDKGIVVDGVELQIDKETVYKTLSNVFGQAKVQGFDYNSAANSANVISGMANKIQANYGVDYGTAMSQVSDAIYNGSNAASAYGIVIDDQILAGYAAMVKELDIVNVQYTDAYLSALRLKLAQEMIAEGNSEKMQKQIKEWKQLGDVIQTASGSLFDFQEVQSIEAKDFEIPNIDANGNIVDESNIEHYKELANAYEQFTVETTKGTMLFKDALALVGGDLSQIVYVWDNELNKGMLMTAERARELSQLEKDRYNIITNGATAVGLYAAQLGLTGDQLAAILGDAQVKVDDINNAVATLVAAKELNINWSDYNSIVSNFDAVLARRDELIATGVISFDITGIRQLISELETALNLKNQLEYSQVSGYDPLIQEYIANGYKFADGSTIDDVGPGTYFNGTYNMFSRNDRKKLDTIDAFANLAGGSNITTARKVTEMLATAVGTYAIGAGVGVAAGPKPGTTAYLQKVSSAALAGHADGGISTNAHLANISEGNKAEAIIPLESDLGINALSAAFIKAGLNGNNSGINVENINIKNDGINIADNANQWRKVASRIENEIATLQRERGGLNSGVR